jgi:GAF domain-containing protein
MSEMNPNQEPQFQYDRWHGQFINYVLRAISILGLFLLAAIFPAAKPGERIGFAVIYLVLLVVTFAPFSNRIKASVTPIAGYLLGLYTLLEYGPWSDATLLLLSAVLFAALLFNRTVDRLVLALSAGTIILVGTINLLGFYTLASPKVPATGFLDWLIYSAGFIVMGISLTWAIDLLKNEFRSVASQFEVTLGLLTKDKAELEQRIEERTVGITKRTEQLRAASYIARQTSEAEDLASLLNIVVNLVTDQFGYYHAGIFLINETADEAILQTASSEGGRRMVERGHSLVVDSQSIVGYVASQKKVRIALDVGIDAVFFNNPDLPMTRSEVALPLLVRNKVLGVLDIQSDQPQAFRLEDMDVLQTLADQVAIAIENARLLDESQTALMQLEAVSTVRTRDAWGKKLQEQKHAFTYTPLGVRAEGSSSEANDNNLKATIALRGQKIGTISLSKKDKTNWSKIDEDMINEIASQVGLAVDNLRLLEDAQQRAKQEQTIGELTTRFSQSLDIDSLLQSAARELGQLPDVSEVSVFIGQLPEQAPQKRRTRRTTG